MIWTRERIFLHPDRDFDDDPVRYVPVRFTNEFRAELNREEKWENVPPGLRLSFTPEEQKAIGLRERPCHFCNDSVSRSFDVIRVGKVTGLRIAFPTPCKCITYKRFWEHWRQVDTRFQDADLDTLTPRALMAISVESQAAIIKLLKGAPDESFFLCGPAGTGKTHFATALYRRVLLNSMINQFHSDTITDHVWRRSTVTLLNEHMAWNSRDQHNPHCETPAPSLTTATIRSVARAGFRPCLFLDEFDKVSMTSPKASCLNDLVDAVYANNGQLVTTSNKTFEQLEKKWDPDDVASLVRRFGKGAEASIVKFVKDMEPRKEVQVFASPIAEDVTPAAETRITSRLLSDSAEVADVAVLSAGKATQPETTSDDRVSSQPEPRYKVNGGITYEPQPIR